MSKNVIYLAGKAHGDKWRLASQITARNVEFIASDNSGEEDDGHGEHCGRTEETCFTQKAVQLIAKSDALIAYLDRPDCYGSIAEIAWAAATNKSCHVIIVNPDAFIPVPNSLAMDYGKYIQSDMYDAYHFVSDLPGVNAITVENESMAAHILRTISVLESPIEHMFYREFCQLGIDVLCKLQAQVKVDNYRVDFMLESEAGKFAVELDGHDYHKTKEQRTNDAQRDRYLISKGIQTIRFTGTEVFRDAWQCVWEFYSMAFPFSKQPSQSMSLAEEAGI